MLRTHTINGAYKTVIPACLKRESKAFVDAR